MVPKTQSTNKLILAPHLGKIRALGVAVSLRTHGMNFWYKKKHEQGTSIPCKNRVDACVLQIMVTKDKKWSVPTSKATAQTPKQQPERALPQSSSSQDQH
jgi:hypothetical protein